MKRPAPLPRGFSLIEVSLALGVAGFCLVAIFGLLPVGLKSSQAAIEQTSATNVLAAVVADLRATAPTSPRGTDAVSEQFKIAIPANGTAASSTFFFTEEGGYSANPEAQSRYRVTLTFLTTAGGRAATLADLKVSWPAPATLANAVGFVETFVALDRN